VLEYYSGSAKEEAEDAYDMRKALTRDPERQSMIPLKDPIAPWDLESTM
jgi:N-terminal acetyltransferase B complex catalytic subunit